jgi:hypothetical protein
MKRLDIFVEIVYTYLQVVTKYTEPICKPNPRN